MGKKLDDWNGEYGSENDPMYQPMPTDPKALENKFEDYRTTAIIARDTYKAIWELVRDPGDVYEYDYPAQIVRYVKKRVEEANTIGFLLSVIKSGESLPVVDTVDDLRKYMRVRKEATTNQP